MKERDVSPPSSALYSLGLDPLSSPRSTRPSPKSAGSASLPAAPLTLTRSKSWESDDKRGRSGTKKMLGLTKLEVLDASSPFEDPLRSPSTSTRGHRTSIMSASTTNDTSSLPPTPDCNYARRLSTLSNSSMSQSPTSPMGMYVPSTSRQRYSIASSSYAHTIGDLSTSSMPLLRQPTRGEESSSNNGTDSNSVVGGVSGSGPGGWTNRYQASSSRVHLAESSRASYYSDDGSSVHSYPPKPRQRTGSTWTSSENGGEGSKNSWTREFETTGATGQIQRRGSADSRNDPWPQFVANSYVHQPIARPIPAYLSQLSTYSFPPATTANTPTKIPPPRPASSAPISRGGALGSSNPLAPLRKRLARSLAGSGGHLHTEVQLLLELVDALDHCITLFSSNSEQAFSPVSRSTPPSNPIPLPPEESAVPSIGPARSAQSKSALLDEVRLLVRELVELVPDAQRCLTNGQYGPLAFPNTTTSRLMQSLEKRPDPSSSAFSPSSSSASPTSRLPRSTSWNSGLTPDWWPSRLVKDCRNLLVEAGLPTGKGSTVWLATRLSEEGNNEDGNLEGDYDDSPRVVVTGASSAPSGGDKEFVETLPDELEPRKGIVVSGGPRSIGPESARKDELLEQGKKRWEAYRKKQMQRVRETDN